MDCTRTSRVSDLVSRIGYSVTRLTWPGSFAPPSSAPEVINPELLFATADGRLGIIGELTPGAAKTMDDLQRNMDKYHKGPGGITWKT